MPETSVENAKKLLARVMDPVFDRPMLEVGTLGDLSETESTLKANVTLSSPAEDLKTTIRDAIKTAIVDTGLALELKFEVRLPTREVMGDDPPARITVGRVELALGAAVVIDAVAYTG